MTTTAQQVRADLTRLADFFDGRTNSGNAPKLGVTSSQLQVIRRNPAEVGAIYGSEGIYYFRGYELYPT